MNEQNKLHGNWDEVRIAYQVARLGTLTAAANHLGVHHATVIRHIDALEARLGSKLFLRNPRRYIPTEAGLELMKTAAKTEDLLGQLAGNLKGHREAVSGDLIVTSLSGLSPQITPLLTEFGRLYPEVRLTFVGDDRPLQLEYGEAHVALRAGSKPQELNNIVQSIGRFPVSLYAHKSYVETHGPLLGDMDAVNHRFVSLVTSQSRIPFQAWMNKYVPDECIVYRVSDMRSFEDAVHAGGGIGFLSLWSGKSNPELVQMTPSMPEWDTKLWLVTHMDLHRTAKVQTLVGFLKSHVVSKLQVLESQQERDVSAQISN
jgi:DNA-binding transcriptional LysR family regulator